MHGVQLSDGRRSGSFVSGSRCKPKEENSVCCYLFAAYAADRRDQALPIIWRTRAVSIRFCSTCFIRNGACIAVSSVLLERRCILTQLKIAWIDEEETYLKQLKGYLIRKREAFLKIHTFSGAEAFLDCREHTEFDAVVMTKSFWETLYEPKAQSKQIFLLEESGGLPFLDCLFVKKYQSAENLLGQISTILWQGKNKNCSVFFEKPAELIGIYSPVHHEDQMLFGMTMAQILGEEQKVLYVNLMEHSGFYQLTETKISEDVGDLIYGMMHKEYDFTVGMRRISRNYKSFDYIPPAVNPEHLSELTEVLFEQLLLELKNCSGYDVVILDFGRIFPGFVKMMPAFESFYCLGREGMVNRLRMEEFTEYLNKEGEHVAAHMNRILLPEQMHFPEAGSPLESSLYGGMGDYIRRCLYGGAEIE